MLESRERALSQHTILSPLGLRSFSFSADQFLQRHEFSTSLARYFTVVYSANCMLSL